jgi:hypothetical protein
MVFLSTIFEMQHFCLYIGGEEARDDGQVPGVQGAEGEGVPGVLRQADCSQVNTVPGVQGAEGEGVPGVLRQADCAQVPTVCVQKRRVAWFCHRLFQEMLSGL